MSKSLAFRALHGQDLRELLLQGSVLALKLHYIRRVKAQCVGLLHPSGMRSTPTESDTLLRAGKLNLEERELSLKVRQLRLEPVNLGVLSRKLLWKR